MTKRTDHAPVPAHLQPEHDEHVDTAVAMGRGELSRTQEREVRARMLQDAGYRAVVAPIVASYEQRRLTETEAGTAWTKFASAAGLPEEVAHAAVGAPAEREQRGRRSALARICGAVAALLLVGLGGAGLYSVTEGPRPVTVATGANESIEVNLTDGTHATLGPSSEIRYPKYMVSMSPRRRIVWPEGQVTLEVRKMDVRTASGQRVPMTLLIDTQYAAVLVAGNARLKVTNLAASTSIDVLEGSVKVVVGVENATTRRGKVVEIAAPAGVRLTANSFRINGTVRVP